MGEVVYRSEVHLERRANGVRPARLPAEPEPVLFGSHGPVAAHYGYSGGEQHATTLDYIVAAACGWLLGTLAGALEARRVSTVDGRLTADATGEVELDDGVLVLRRIHVVYRLTAGEEKRDAVERAHTHHHSRCPVYRSIGGSVEITTELHLMPA